LIGYQRNRIISEYSNLETSTFHSGCIRYLSFIITCLQICFSQMSYWIFPRQRTANW